jgi:transcriptional regulator with XRE-family HTH domain
MNRPVDTPLSKFEQQTTVKVMNLKSQLKLYLELRSLTAAELSRKSGVSKQVISLWLNGAEPKKISQVKQVAGVLNTTVDHLCFGSGKEVESQKVTELDALMGDGWLGGLFEVKFRRVRNNGGGK